MLLQEYFPLDYFFLALNNLITLKFVFCLLYFRVCVESRYGRDARKVDNMRGEKRGKVGLR